MYAQYKSGADAERLRKMAGQWLKRKRLEREMTQRDLAEEVGLKYYTFVSQIENGQGRIPADVYEKWAHAIGMKPSEFAKKMLMYYDPFTYKALFGPPKPSDHE